MSDSAILAVEAGLRYGVITIAVIQLIAVAAFLAYEYQGMPAAKRSLVELLRPLIIRFWVIMSVFNALNCACSFDHYMYMTEISDLSKCFLYLCYFIGYGVSGVLYLLGVYYRCDPILTSHPWKSKFHKMTMIANGMMVMSTIVTVTVVFAYGAPERKPFVWQVFPAAAGTSLSILCFSYAYLFMDYFRKSNALGANKPANYDRCRNIAFWGLVSAHCILFAGLAYIVRFALVTASIPDRIASFVYHTFVTLGMVTQLMMRKKSNPGKPVPSKQESNATSTRGKLKTTEMSTGQTSTKGSVDPHATLANPDPDATLANPEPDADLESNKKGQNRI